MPLISKQSSNWSRSVCFTPSASPVVRTDGEILEWIREARNSGKGMRVAGSGHSFTSLIETQDILLRLAEPTQLLEVDHATNEVLVGAGTRLFSLGRWLFKEGLAQENLGDIDRQTISGAVSTGTHGTGIQFGSLSTQIIGLTLITSQGEIVDCSPQRDVATFKAAQVSLGALGVISKVRLKLIPSFKLRFEKSRQRLDDFLPNLEGLIRKHRHFEFFWFPFTDYAVVKTGDEVDEPINRNWIFRDFQNVFLENLVFKIFCELCRLMPKISPAMCRLQAALSGGKQVDTNYSHAIFATPRYVRFNEMEYCIPRVEMRDTIEEIRAHLKTHKYFVNFPIEVRFGKRDDIFLSPAYERDPGFISVHMYQGMEYRPYFAAIESIFRNHQGRPHWGKLHTLKAQQLSKLYPKWDAFLQVREKLDPKRVFLNSYLREIFGVQ